MLNALMATSRFRCSPRFIAGATSKRKDIYHVSIADRTHTLRLRLPVAHQAFALHPSSDGSRTGDRVPGYKSLYLPNAAPTYRSVGNRSCRTRGETRRYGSCDGLG